MQSVIDNYTQYMPTLIGIVVKYKLKVVVKHMFTLITYKEIRNRKRRNSTET